MVRREQTNMKKIFRKFKKHLHNKGSGLILVIVALAFIGILVGALLTAVSYVYRQKLYDYNAKSNFNYLDQAMDQVYERIGSLTMNDLMEAYQKTREDIVYFDTNTKSYENMSNEDANLIFKKYFILEVAQDPNFTTAKIKDVIRKSITVSNIELDASKLNRGIYLLRPDLNLEEFSIITNKNNFESFVEEFRDTREDVMNIIKIIIEQNKIEPFIKFIQAKNVENNNKMKEFIKSKYFDFVESMDNIKECKSVVGKTNDVIEKLEKKIQEFLEEFKLDFIERIKKKEQLKQISKEKQKLNTAYIFFAYMNKANIAQKNQQYELSIKTMDYAYNNFLKKFLRPDGGVVRQLPPFSPDV